MKTYSAAELSEILKKHSDWWYGRPDGCRANLRGANLCGANLRGANLSDANLCGANLRGANLRGANLCDVNLCGANLCGADLCDANLCGANLRGADLCDANLCGANLRGANLSDANLCDVNYDERTAMYALACPEVGSFIGWKKASGRIIKLEITEDAMRSSATTRKCRCSKAKVLAIENLDGTASNCTAVQSNYDPLFIYEVGAVVSVDNFDTNRWNECAPGIHFFITRDEAVQYI